VAALDSRSAAFGAGTNGAMAAFNVLLDVFASGDEVTGFVGATKRRLQPTLAPELGHI